MIDLHSRGGAQTIHGHTHDCFDYFLNGTPLVCNPRGYAKNAVNENPLFDANFIVEIV